MNLVLSKSDMKELLDVAACRKKADLIVKNVRLVDVYCEKIYPAEIVVHKGRVVAVNPDHTPEAKEIFDGGGLYAMPGFVDPHYHVDSTQGTPASLSGVIVPCGTTTLCGELLDITHFAGIYGQDPVATAIAYAKDYDKLPYRLLPLAPGKMSPPDVTRALLKWDGSFGLGEVLSHNILCQVDDYLDIIEGCHRDGKYVSGHILHIVWDFPNNDVTQHPSGPCRQMDDDEINQFAIIGYPHDHEIFKYDDVERVLKRGMNPMVRTFEGLDKKVMPGVLNDHLPLEHMSFCMDDIFMQDIARNGFMNKAIQHCIEMGYDPIQAIKMGTINNAINIGLERHVGSITPGRFADLLLVPSMSDITPKYVFRSGELVAQNGKLIHEPIVDYSSLQWDFTQHLQGMAEAELEIPAEKISADGKTGEALVYNVLTRAYETYWVPVEDGKLQSDLSQDIILGAVVDRTPERKVKHLFFKGFHLQEGGMAINFTQNVYRIIACGVHEKALLEAVREVDRHLGGSTAVTEDGKVIATFDMDIAGCASSLPYVEHLAKANQLDQQVRDWGVNIDNAFMILWFTGFLYLWD